MNTDSEPWYRQFWPWFLIALPATVAVAGVGMLLLALTHYDSRVRDNYYKDGLAINQVLAQDRNAAQRSIAAQLELGEGLARLQLRGAFETLPQQLALKFIHPLDDARDFTLMLHAIGGGDYVSSQAPQLTMQRSGHWYIELSESSADAAAASDWRLRGNLRAGGDGHLELTP